MLPASTALPTGMVAASVLVVRVAVETEVVEQVVVVNMVAGVVVWAADGKRGATRLRACRLARLVLARCASKVSSTGP